MTSPGTSTAAIGARVRDPLTIGSNPAYPKVFGGQTRFIFGGRSPSTGVNNLYWWHWNGTSYDNAGAPLLIDNLGANNSTTATGQTQRIATDEDNNIWQIDTGGVLRLFQYDFTNRVWKVKNKAMAQGLTDTNLIVAAGHGDVFTRSSAGALSIVSNQPVGLRARVGDNRNFTGLNPAGFTWNIYTKMFAIGGGNANGLTVFGITSAGALEMSQYAPGRILPGVVSSGSWTVLRRVLATTGFSAYTNMWGASGQCASPADASVPTAPTVPASTNAPLSVLPRTFTAPNPQPVDFALTDNIGRIQLVHQDNSNFIPRPVGTPTTISGADAYSGQPQLFENGTALDVLALNRNSRVSRASQTAPQTTPTWTDQGGLMVGSPSVVKLSNGAVVAVARDAQGQIWLAESAWFRGGTTSTPQADLGRWNLIGSISAVGSAALADLGSGKVGIVVRDSVGTLWAATYQTGVTGVLSGWGPLSDSGFVSDPKVMAAPGGLMRVVARNASGAVVTQAQTAPGTLFSGTWSAVSTPTLAAGVTPVGTPNVIMEPVDGRVFVVVRGSDGLLYVAPEFAQACGSFNPWSLVSGTAFTSDPAVYTVSGPKLAVAAYDVGFAITAFYNVDSFTAPPPGVCQPALLAAGRRGATTVRAVPTAPTFTAVRISGPVH